MGRTRWILGGALIGMLAGCSAYSQFPGAARRRRVAPPEYCSLHRPRASTKRVCSVDYAPAEPGLDDGWAHDHVAVHFDASDRSSAV
jgi:hypothetical protein